MADSWLRLDTRGALFGWTGKLPDYAFACWIKLLQLTKAHGRRGCIAVKYFDDRILAAMNTTEEHWQIMVGAGIADGAIRIEDGTIQIAGWSSYQQDTTGGARQKRWRKKPPCNGNTPLQDEPCNGNTRYVTKSPLSLPLRNACNDDGTGHDGTGRDMTGHDPPTPFPPLPPNPPAATLAEAFWRRFGSCGLRGITLDDAMAAFKARAEEGWSLDALRTFANEGPIADCTSHRMLALAMGAWGKEHQTVKPKYAEPSPEVWGGRK